MTSRRNSTVGRPGDARRYARSVGTWLPCTRLPCTWILGTWILGTWLLGGALAGCLAGCVAGQPNVMHPGDLQSQRYNAIAHDPYADSDAGPEIVGGRPRDFQKPLPEPVRNRWLMDSWWARR